MLGLILVRVELWQTAVLPNILLYCLMQSTCLYSPQKPLQVYVVAGIWDRSSVAAAGDDDDDDLNNVG